MDSLLLKCLIHQDVLRNRTNGAEPNEKVIKKLKNILGGPNVFGQKKVVVGR